MGGGGAEMGLAFGVTIYYCIWQERNNRIFQNNAKTVDNVLGEIACTWSWRVQK